MHFKRLANPQPLVEVPSGDAPVHQIKITGKDVDLKSKLPFHPQHAYDGSCYMSCDRLYGRPGDRPPQCRLPPLSLRNRYAARDQ